MERMTYLIIEHWALTKEMCGCWRTGLERFEAGYMDEGRKVLETENGSISEPGFLSRAGSNKRNSLFFITFSSHFYIRWTSRY